MEDLTDKPVTTQELDDWLRSTSVDGGAGGAGGGETQNELGEEIPLPVLPELTIPPLPLPLPDCQVVAPATVGRSQRQYQWQKQECDDSPRRSSLNDTHKLHSFGIDERKMLMTIDSNDSTGQGEAYGCPPGKDAFLNPNFRPKDASIIGGSDAYMEGYTPGFSEAAKLPPPLEPTACSVTRAPNEAVPACNASCPPSKRKSAPGVSREHLGRSLSLPEIVSRAAGVLDDCGDGRPVLEHSHSMPAGRRHRSAHFSLLSTMERSQQSQDLYLMSGVASCTDDSNPKRSFSATRDTCESRGRVLQMLGGRGAVGPRVRGGDRARDEVRSRGRGSDDVLAGKSFSPYSRRRRGEGAPGAGKTPDATPLAPFPPFSRRLRGEGAPRRWKTPDATASAITKAHAGSKHFPRHENVNQEDPDEMAIRAELARIARGIR